MDAGGARRGGAARGRLWGTGATWTAVLLMGAAACAPAAPPPPTTASAPAPTPTAAPAQPAAGGATAPTQPTAAPKPTAAPAQPTAAPKPTSAPATSAPAAQPTAAPAAALATSPQAAASASLTKLNVSHPDGGGHLPLFYARDKGIFAAHGLDVTLLPLGGGPPAAAALQSDQTQVADITGSEIVSADANGADTVVIGTLVPVYPYVFEVSKQVTGVEDLKGKTIAVRAQGDATDVATRIALRKLGLDPDKDVTILALAQEGARMAALQSGQICCTVAQPQDRLILEGIGFHSLFDLSALGLPNSQGTLAVKRSYLNANRETVQRFVDAVVEAIGKAKRDKAGALPVLKSQLKLDDDKVVEATYDYFIGSGTVVPSVPMPTAAQFADSIALLAEKNEKLKGFDISRFIDASLVQSAEQRGLARP